MAGAKKAENEAAREYLKIPAACRCRIEIFTEEIQFLKHFAKRHQNAALEKHCAKTCKKYLARIAEEKQKIQVIANQIEGMENPRHREILKRYCIDGQKIRRIADDLYYSESRALHLYCEATEMFYMQYLQNPKQGQKLPDTGTK